MKKINLSIKLLLFIILTSCSSDKEIKPKTTVIVDQHKSTWHDFFQSFRSNDLLDDSKFIQNDFGKNVLLLLPLSGANKSIGEGILKACTLAIHENKDDNIMFVVSDTGKDTSDQFSLYDQFKDKNLDAVIGPVFFNEAHQFGALFPNVPLLSLSNNIKINNEHVIACGISPEEELRHLFLFMKRKHIDSLTVILPENKYYNQILGSIKKMWLAHKMDESKLDVIRYTKITKQDATRHVLNSCKNAVFVIEPILLTDALKDIHILTLSNVATSNTKEMDRAIFAFSNNDTHSSFVEKYKSLFKRNPNTVEIVAYDITHAVIKSLKNEEDILNSNHKGCLGNFYIDKKYGLRRKLSILKIFNGNIVRY